MRADPEAPPTHGTVLVTCEETWYVVDASILHSAPLPLHESAPTSVAHPAWGVHCRKRDGTWYIRWRPVHQPDGLDCRLQYLHVSRETFRERHEQSRPGVRSTMSYMRVPFAGRPWWGWPMASVSRSTVQEA